MPGRAARRDQGVATVWGLAWIAVCLTVGWFAVLAASIMSAQHHLDAAADLAAISGAARLQRGGDACALAARIARDNGAALTACEVEGSDVLVTVADVLALPFSLDARISARSRAGP